MLNPCNRMLNLLFVKRATNSVPTGLSNRMLNLLFIKRATNSVPTGLSSSVIVLASPVLSTLVPTV